MLRNTTLTNNVDIAEIYSPPRITEAAARVGLKPGLAFDVLNGWDLMRRKTIKTMMSYIDSVKPKVLIGSPPCTPFSQLSTFSASTADPEERAAKLAEGRQHLETACRAYKAQIKGKRFFVHEHPWGATSWSEPSIREVMNMPGVMVVRGDQCMHGLTTTTPDGEVLPAMKPTGFMTNCPLMAEALSKRCDGGHTHAQLVGNRAGPAAIYTPQLVKAFCEGALRRKHALDQREPINVTQVMREIMAMETQTTEQHPHPHEAEYDYQGDWEEHFDTSTGQLLPTPLVHKARMEEMAYIHKYHVYDKVPAQQVEAENGIVIDTKWVDVNKGDERDPNVRSRLVGREIRNRGRGRSTEDRNDLFAATPPLSSLRMMLSMSASRQVGKRGSARWGVLFVDVSRAYFNAEARRPIFIKIPSEDFVAGQDEGKLGRLRKCLYGTRDAAQNWEEAYSRFLVSVGFRRGKASPCHFSFAGEQREIMITVHGDDFTAAGSLDDLRWLQRKFQQQYEVKSKLLGPEDEHDCVQDVRVLNRLVSWTSNGIMYESDPRHAEIIIKEMGLSEAKGVQTPGEKCEHNSETEDQHMTAADATAYRGLTARAMYLSLDRPDLSFAAKELARSMAQPLVADWSKLKRFARFLITQPRAAYLFGWQQAPTCLWGAADADWAGDARSRKSTSGGAVFHGDHLVHHWSSTQKLVATSSGESELYALTKCASQVLGLISTAADFGVHLNGAVNSDSSAAIGISQRRGLQRLRHVEVQYLWVQEKFHSGALAVRKIRGEDNVADMMTKHIGSDLREKLMAAMNMAYLSGRHHLAPDSISNLFRASRVAEQAARGSCPETQRALPASETGTSFWREALGQGELFEPADFWVETRDCWIRNHRRPRRALFTPAGTEDGPDCCMLNSERITWMHGSGAPVQDSWRGKRPHTFTARSWTGATVFVKAGCAGGMGAFTRPTSAQGCGVGGGVPRLPPITTAIPIGFGSSALFT